MQSNSNVSHDIQLILQETLISALEHSHAQTGLIGLIDDDFDEIRNIWQIHPGNASPMPIENINLHAFPEISEDMIKPLFLEDSALTKILGLPKNFLWHYLILSEVEQDRFSIIILHLSSPHELVNQDKEYSANLKDHTSEKLRQAFLYEDLHDAIQAKNEFISFISHELRNPLTVINSYADIMRKGITGETNSQQQEYLTTIIQNVKRMNTFIKDLSDQSHIETKTLQLVIESTPIQEVIIEVLSSYEAQIKEKSLEVVMKFNDSLPNMWCDRLRIIQILSNLLSNAIKYTPEGGTIYLGAEHTQNKWDISGAAEVVHFWVKDTGYGISTDDQSRIFGKFYRASDERIQRISGAGLGLLIAKSLTEMMGGKMWFDSIKDKGSTFHFTVPI
ncbi:MAG: HAMP domain-containing sensor histidine kinase [Chloroflexota bacterium]|nr:HAMP domain-containing sensor histidine kinase [Chloroflexota bacterium]